jgi:C1A family cysteine protease
MALCANDANFMSYSSGIYSPDVDDCPCYPNHTILIVGYGFDTSEYWIILNYWATSWGVGGYARVDFGIAGNPDCGMCGMFCDWISYPTMLAETFDEAEWQSGSTWN